MTIYLFVGKQLPLPDRLPDDPLLPRRHAGGKQPSFRHQLPYPTGGGLHRKALQGRPFRRPMLPPKRAFPGSIFPASSGSIPASPSSGFSQACAWRLPTGCWWVRSCPPWTSPSAPDFRTLRISPATSSSITAVRRRSTAGPVPSPPPANKHFAYTCRALSFGEGVFCVFQLLLLLWGISHRKTGKKYHKMPVNAANFSSCPGGAIRYNARQLLKSNRNGAA